MPVSAGGEAAEEAQALADLSEGELDTTRPGEEEGDASRADRAESHEDNLEQGERRCGGEGGGRHHAHWKEEAPGMAGASEAPCRSLAPGGSSWAWGPMQFSLSLL